MNKIILLSLTFLCLFSCSKNHLSGDKFITLSYTQTYCSDPWITASNDSLTLLNAFTYLNTNVYPPYSINLLQKNTPELCSSCTCKTGKIIFVTIFDLESAKEKYIKIGFK